MLRRREAPSRSMRPPSSFETLAALAPQDEGGASGSKFPIGDFSPPRVGIDYTARGTLAGAGLMSKRRKKSTSAAAPRSAALRRSRALPKANAKSKNGALARELA